MIATMDMSMVRRMYIAVQFNCSGIAEAKLFISNQVKRIPGTTELFKKF